VNVPLGGSKQKIRNLAKESSTTVSNLARVLILDGIERLESGEFKFRGPSIAKD
jgi:hypothetical protein